MIKFSVREYGLGEFADCEVVFLCPAFLEADDVWCWCGRGYSMSDFEQTFAAEGCEVFEAPAVECQDVEFCWCGVVHCEGLRCERW